MTHGKSVVVPVDDLAQEIRRVDGNHDLGAGALAEALMPFLSSRLSAAPAPDGAIVRWRGENIPYTCPYPSIGARGSPYGYNIDPGAGSGMDRLQRNWPDRAQVRDMRERDGEITPLFPSYALATREEAPAEAGEVTADSLRSVSDETVRALLSCKDVGSGRAHLASIINALLAQPPARSGESQ